MKLTYVHEKERAAIEWAKAAYGRGWRKRVSNALADEERSFPYPNLKHVCARPFGRKDWNIHLQWARICILRNTYLRDIQVVAQ